MMNRLFLYFFFVLIISVSCTQQKTEQSSSSKSELETPDSIYKQAYEGLVERYVIDYSNRKHISNDSIKTFVSKSVLQNIQMEASYELTKARKKYDDRLFSEEVLNDSLAYVKVYPIQQRGSLDGSPFGDRSTDGKIIAISDYYKLVKILKSPKSYGNGMAACFEPKIGLIMYDREKIPLGHVSICLDCNQFRSSLKTTAPNSPFRGFSKEARQKLRTLFFSWGFDYYGFFHGDDEEVYNKYLESKKSN